MKKNSVIASGTTNGAVLTPTWSSTCSSICWVTVSNVNCNPLGTPALARAAM
jgi:hypothetical protein